jgi:hypothetical protein
MKAYSAAPNNLLRLALVRIRSVDTARFVNNLDSGQVTSPGISCDVVTPDCPPERCRAFQCPLFPRKDGSATTAM